MSRRKVLVVGSGTRFLSGISYYTHRLACSLAVDHEVSVLLMRSLLPARFYPGRDRVGKQLTRLDYPDGVRVYDGLDWLWGRSLLGALRFIKRQRPEVMVLQWWTGTVLHSYLLLAIVARALGCSVVLEVHEAQDVGEMGVPGAATYVRRTFPFLLRRCAAIVVHSEFDRQLVDEHFQVGAIPTVVVPHGAYTPLAAVDSVAPRPTSRETNLLFFGVIRPFKGLEDLLDAFALLRPDQAAGLRLTVVGETWEGWARPAELIASHRYRDRIDFHNEYVSDATAAALFAAADAMVLPYHRSSSSGPLQVAIGNGLPVMVTSVGGLVEAASGYSGAVFIEPKSPESIVAALPALLAKCGIRHAQTSSWLETRIRYDALFERILSDGSVTGPTESRVLPSGSVTEPSQSSRAS